MKTQQIKNKNPISDDIANLFFLKIIYFAINSTKSKHNIYPHKESIVILLLHSSKYLLNNAIKTTSPKRINIEAFKNLIFFNDKHLH